jgi:probable rRNA maturation factor
MTEAYNNIEISVACDEDVPDPAFIRNWVTRTVESARNDGRAREVSVRIVGTDEVRTLNRDYRQRDYATNVLSFPTGDIEGLPEEEALALGDVVICAPVVADEASQQGKELADHWAHMLVHGTLHLLGYDHEAEHEALAMETLETGILAAGGVNDPYE